MNASLLRRSGTLQLARAVRDKRISSRELCEHAIARIEAINPKLNALIVDRFEQARSEAAAADEALARGHAHGALWGLPCTIKEMFALEGFPQTGGSVYQLERRAKQSSEVVARLRLAGAIIVGLTNVPEMGMWMETHNIPFGTTANPYDERRTSGGSSGGEAALLAAGATALAVGSDIGGSIRIPAAFCGVFGHKPTGGLVSLAGHYPMPHGAVDGICAAGPLSRRAEDLELLLRVLAKEPAPNGPLEPANADLLRGRTLLYFEQLGGLVSPPTSAVRDALQKARRALEQRGMRSRPFRHPTLWLAPLIHGASITTAGGPTFENLIAKDDAIDLLAETARWAWGKPRHTPEALALVAIERAMARFSGQTQKLMAKAAELKAALDAELDAGALLICPPYPRVAPEHRWPLRRPFDYAYTALFNAFELPATVIPAGHDPETQMPLSVQVAAGRNKDHLTLSAALALQDDLHGRKKPALD
jgi:fatty acid amide hydrolase 2